MPFSNGLEILYHFKFSKAPKNIKQHTKVWDSAGDDPKGTLDLPVGGEVKLCGRVNEGGEGVNNTLLAEDVFVGGDLELRQCCEELRELHLADNLEQFADLVLDGDLRVLGGCEGSLVSLQDVDRQVLQDKLTQLGVAARRLGLQDLAAAHNHTLYIRLDHLWLEKIINQAF